jgi:hypothetical protein
MSLRGYEENSGIRLQSVTLWIDRKALRLINFVLLLPDGRVSATIAFHLESEPPHLIFLECGFRFYETDSSNR